MTQAPDLPPHVQRATFWCLPLLLLHSCLGERGTFRSWREGAGEGRGPASRGTLQGCACLLFFLLSGSQQETELRSFHFIHYDRKKNKKKRNALRTPEGGGGCLQSRGLHSGSSRLSVIGRVLIALLAPSRQRGHRGWVLGSPTEGSEFSGLSMPLGRQLPLTLRHHGLLLSLAFHFQYYSLWLLT